MNSGCQLLATNLLMQTLTLTHRSIYQLQLKSALSPWVCLVTAELCLIMIVTFQLGFMDLADDLGSRLSPAASPQPRLCQT